MKTLLSRLVISLLIGGVMLYLASREISFAGVGTALASARWIVLLPFVLCMAAQHFFRSWRWGQLLAPIHSVPFRRLLPVSSVGFFAILALPLRMGELVRPYLIATPPRLTMSHGLGTMAVERVFDGLILSLTASSAVMIAKLQGTDVPPWVSAAGMVASLLFVAALGALVMALWQKDRAVVLCRRLFALASHRLADKAANVAADVVDGFRVLPHARHLLAFLGATLWYWLLNALSLWFLARGFGLDLGLWPCTAVMALIGIGIMIPAGPGFIGNFELFAEGALTLYLPRQVLQQRGVAFILASHAAAALWYALTGTIAMMSAHVSFSRLIDASTDAAAHLEETGKKVDTEDQSTDARGSESL